MEFDWKHLKIIHQKLFSVSLKTGIYGYDNQCNSEDLIYANINEATQECFTGISCVCETNNYVRASNDQVSNMFMFLE